MRSERSGAERGFSVWVGVCEMFGIGIGIGIDGGKMRGEAETRVGRGPRERWVGSVRSREYDEW